MKYNKENLIDDEINLYNLNLEELESAYLEISSLVDNKYRDVNYILNCIFISEQILRFIEVRYPEYNFNKFMENHLHILCKRDKIIQDILKDNSIVLHNDFTCIRFINSMIPIIKSGNINKFIDEMSELFSYMCQLCVSYPEVKRIRLCYLMKAVITMVAKIVNISSNSDRIKNQMFDKLDREINLTERFILDYMVSVKIEYDKEMLENEKNI